MSDDRATTRQVKGAVGKSVLSYVRRVLGNDAAEAVLDRAGSELAGSGLGEAASWTTTTPVLALARAAAEVCGDTDIGWRAGEELMRLTVERGTADFLLATGSVAAALELAANNATKMSGGRVYEVTDVGDTHVEITARYEDVAHADPFFCHHSSGAFSAIPGVFGHRGVAAEPECMCRGDDRCRYRIAWSADRVGAAVGSDQVDTSRARMESFVARFEQLHLMATDLAGAEQVATLLARITDRAGLAVDAHRYLLAVHDRRGNLRIHHNGFADEDAAHRFAARLLEGRVDDDRTVAADVASAERYYGRLAAVYPRGSVLTEMERRLLVAYARHAAAAIEAVASLETARRDRDAAEALLGLATALAEVGSREDVAVRLAAAVPGVTACARGSVWLWDPAEEGLRLAAAHPAPPPELADARAMVLRRSEVPAVDQLVGDPTPFFLTIEGAAQPIRSLMERDGIARSAIVPIRARGEFLGVVVAGFAEDEGAARVDAAAADVDVAPAAAADAHRGGDEDLLVLLRGLADQAATALDNARLLETIRDQALQDALTGLPNRRLMEDRAAQALRLATRGHRGATVMFIDLDRFKDVNDTLGHEVGDELIREAARRLSGVLRASDTIARVGGDEFVVLLPDTNDPTAVETVARKLLDELKRPFLLEGREVCVAGSLGVACAPRHGTDYATLLKHADAAMYRAKRAGGDTYSFYSAASAPGGRERLELESELRNALDRNELRVVYQPQVDLRTLRIIGVEALVRWQHPTMGRLAPDRFLRVAEDSGLITGIDAWVRSRAIEHSREWRRRGIDVRVGVNVSERSLRQPGLADDVAALLAAGDVPADRLELEVADRVLLDDEELTDSLARLHELGVRIAIDDFGNGTSVLRHLQRCPIDTVKIDRGFLDEVADDDEAPVLTALLVMTRSLGLDVVAEGVETEAQRRFLLAAGCRVVQGFLLGPPVDVAAVDELLSSGAVTAAATPPG